MAFFSKITNIFKKKKKDEYWFVPENSNSNSSRHASQNTSKYESYTEAEVEKPLKAKKAAKESKKEKRATTPIQKEAQPQKVDKNISKNKKAISPTLSEIKAEELAQKSTDYIEEEADAIAKEETVEETSLKKFNGMFEIKKSKDERYVFNLYASNHVIIATSQIYSSAKNALTGINSVIANAPRADIEDQTAKDFAVISCPKWEIYLDKAEQYRFRLRATNGSCICHSQGYTSKASCKNGIESIKRTAKNARIDKSYQKSI